jgi:hypothetical protein
MTKIGIVGGGGTTIADPFVATYNIDRSKVESSQRALDGTLRSQVVALKRVWHVEWHGLAATPLSTLMTELDRLVNLAWYPPEGGGPITVKAKNIKQTALKGPFTRTNVTCDLEEV